MKNRIRIGVKTKIVDIFATLQSFFLQKKEHWGCAFTLKLTKISFKWFIISHIILYIIYYIYHKLFYPI